MGSNQPPNDDDKSNESSADRPASAPDAGGSGDSVDPHPHALPYATPSRAPKLKTIRQLSSFEANLAAAKLQAAGLTAFVIDDNISTAYPLVFASVKLQVPEDQVARAETVLSEPAIEPADHEHEDGDDEDSAADFDDSDAPPKVRSLDGAKKVDDDDYVEETYRCPKCHRKDVELLPLAGVMRQVRFGCLTVLMLPLLAGFATWLMHQRSSGASPPDLFAPEVVFAWMAVLGILSFVVITAKRRKRCRTCGNEWVN